MGSGQQDRAWWLSALAWPRGVAAVLGTTCVWSCSGSGAGLHVPGVKGCKWGHISGFQHLPRAVQGRPGHQTAKASLQSISIKTMQAAWRLLGLVCWEGGARVLRRRGFPATHQHKATQAEDYIASFLGVPPHWKAEKH